MPANAPPPLSPHVTRGEVARGAGLAGLARAGALIEALAQPLYTRLFGVETYGVYVALWARSASPPTSSTSRCRSRSSAWCRRRATRPAPTARSSSP